MPGWDPGRRALDGTIGSDRLISLTIANEGRRYFSLDGLRSVVNLTDDDGNEVASYHLDAWGNFRFPQELNDSANRFAFTGHIYDQETGLYNAKARYFDPKLGRFLTQDSYLGQIDEPPSLHRYLYANANPLTFFDPTGHASFQTQEIDQLQKEVEGYTKERDQTQVPKIDRVGDEKFEWQGVSPVLWNALHRSGGKEGALKRLEDFRAGNVKNYAITIIEESDFDSNGRLDRDKLYQQFLKQVGGHAGALKGLREEFFAAVDGARAGESREISFLYNVSHEYSTAKAEELARQDAEQHFGPDFIQRNAHLAGQWGAAPPEVSAKAAAVLAADTVAAAALGLEIYRAGAAVLSTPSTAPAVRPRPGNTTRLGVKRNNPSDMRQWMEHWDQTGVDAFSDANRAAIKARRNPVVDEQWIKHFPDDAQYLGEPIRIHHIGGTNINVPLPKSRHLDAHMPGGFRYNPGGPGRSG